ncbi:hypothetical protein GC170_13870 [bacterium]|nr:hypothetical protein [bacterium]
MRYTYSRLPERDPNRSEREYEDAVQANAKVPFLRILRKDYMKYCNYPPGVVGPFALCGTEESASGFGFAEMERWWYALQNGYLGQYLGLRSVTIEAEAFWPVRFWLEVAKSADDEDKPLYDHPGLALAANDEIRKAFRRYQAWYPPEIEPEETSDLLEEDEEMIKARSGYSFSAPDTIADTLRCSIYQRQLRIGEAVDLMKQEVRKSASYDRMREIVAYALTGEPDPYLEHPWDQDEVTERFVRNDAKNPFVIRANGISLWRRGQYQAAEMELRRAAGLFENDPLGRFAWASCMQILGMDFEPESAMGEISQDHPQFRTQEAKRLAWLASLYERLGQDSQAVASAERSVGLHPFERGAWLILAQAKRRDGDLPGASAAEAFVVKIDDAREKLQEASKAALYVNDKRAFRSGIASILGEIRIIRPDPSRMEPLAEQWIEAAEACGWHAGAEIWRILRDHRDNKEAIERLQLLAETPEFREDAFFFPRPTLKAGEPSTILRVQRWLYGL